MHKFRILSLVFLVALSAACALGGCGSGGEILSETDGDTGFGKSVSDYTGSVERVVTIKNSQSGSFSVQLAPSSGSVQLCITDGAGDTILSRNEQATLTATPTTTRVAQGNGSYRVSVEMSHYSGSFDVAWEIADGADKADGSGA